MISHYLAVDGGASKTALRLTPVQFPDASAATVTTGPSSLTLPGQGGIATLVEAITALLRRHRLSPAEVMLVAGVAGAGNPARKAALEKALATFAHKAITTDAHIACLGAGGGKAVNCIAVGSGAVAARLDQDGNVALCGGWGFPIADRGGGAWLGFMAVRALIAAIESGAFPPLGETLGTVIGRQRPALIAWLATADASEYARLAPIVLQCAATHCPAARRIVRKGVVHIKRLVKNCCEGNDLPIVFRGGLGQYYQTRLKRKWRNRCIAAQGDALDGARELARQLAGEHT